MLPSAQPRSRVGWASSTELRSAHVYPCVVLFFCEMRQVTLVQRHARPLDGCYRDAMSWEL